jgi:hypothetical protein
MPFKQLNLDRSRFQACIDEFFGDTATKMVQRSPILWQINRIVDNKELILQFHYLNDGTTTLGCKVGNNQTKSKELAEYIKKTTLIDPRNNITLAFSNFAQGSLDQMITFLAKVPGVKLADDRKDKTARRILKFTGQQNDTVTLVYHTNSTLTLQGRPVTLYSQIIAFLSEYLSLGEIIQSQSMFIPVPIRTSDIEYELHAKMPFADSKLDATMRKMLCTSLVFTKLDIDLPDYTALVFPALRALEGHLKALFYSKGFVIGKEGFGIFFDYNGLKHFLNLDTRQKIGCSKSCTAIENSYNYYYNHRHSLFHSEVVPLASSIIEDRGEAIRMIDTVINIIEDSHHSLSV